MYFPKTLEHIAGFLFMNTQSFHLSEARVSSVLELSLTRADPAHKQDLARKAAELGVASISASFQDLPMLHALKMKHPNFKISVPIDLPDGDNGPWETGECASFLAQNNVDEISVTLPLDTLSRDSGELIRWVLEAAREAAPKAVIKAVLNTSTLATSEDLKKAAGAAVAGGADFLQIALTESGKNATALNDVLSVLQACPSQVGIAITSHRSTNEDIESHWQHIERALGVQWCHKKRFRIVVEDLATS